MAIFRALYGDRSHPSADAVYSRVRKEFPHISFDTVNRTLQSFATLGLIAVAESYGRQRRYDTRTGQHHHLYCVKCHKIIDFESRDYDSLRVPDYISNTHTVLGKRVVLEGVCAQCSKKERKEHHGRTVL